MSDSIPWLKLFKPVVFLVALIPLISLVSGAINNTLGANPTETMTEQPISQANLEMSKTPGDDQKIVTTAIDDPETPDELESENLQLLTNINEEDEEQAEEAKDKTVAIN